MNDTYREEKAYKSYLKVSTYDSDNFILNSGIKDNRTLIEEMPEGEEREQLSLLIAHHMKKQLLVSNKDGVDDAKVFSDLAYYTKGAISLDPEIYHLNEFKELVQSQPQVKKNKKRK